MESKPVNHDARRPRGRATMQHVAALAGVSLKTVSRVVNHEPGVSAELGGRVQSAMTQLGYRHNLAASNLRRGQRTASIGMLVQDLSNSFCAEVLRAVEDRARLQGVVVMAASIDESARRERELVDGLVSRRIDGLLLMPASRDQSYLEPDIAAGLAVVAVDRRPLMIRMDAVVADNAGGATEGMGHLMARGHRRIAFLGDDGTIPTAAERRDAYRMALRTAGVTADPDLEQMGLRTLPDARAAVLAMLDLPDPPTAIFAGRNVITLGAVLALQDRGLQHRVALLGFDEVEVSEMVDPHLSVVRQDTYEIGARSIDLLLARLDGDRSPIRTEVVPTTLVPRGSGEIPAP